MALCSTTRPPKGKLLCRVHKASNLAAARFVSIRRCLLFAVELGLTIQQISRSHAPRRRKMTRSDRQTVEYPAGAAGMIGMTPATAAGDVTTTGPRARPRRAGMTPAAAETGSTLETVISVAAVPSAADPGRLRTTTAMTMSHIGAGVPVPTAERHRMVTALISLGDLGLTSRMSRCSFFRKFRENLSAGSRGLSTVGA